MDCALISAEVPQVSRLLLAEQRLVVLGGVTERTVLVIPARQQLRPDRVFRLAKQKLQPEGRQEAPPAATSTNLARAVSLSPVDQRAKGVTDVCHLPVFGSSVWRMPPV